MLRSETDSTRMENLVRKAGKEFLQTVALGSVRIRAAFEHGHWWLLVTQLHDPYEEFTYSVGDADGPGSFGGFDFEQV